MRGVEVAHSDELLADACKAFGKSGAAYNKQEMLKCFNDDADLFLSKVDRWMDQYNPDKVQEMHRS
jgi:hypothetical protein